jgi:VIT1/CCC1 family predicted Fe2+/Mn2+ transporter
LSFHEKLARVAIAKGKDAEEFSAAAQKHANATWVYAIIFGIIYYFFGMSAWAAIPAVLGIWCLLQSISATMTAKKIEDLLASRGL